MAVTPYQVINVGTVANDGTGDPLRTAFIKVNDNFALVTTNLQVNYAPLASPIFTGDPQAPTPAVGDNDNSIATTAWVKSLLVDPDMSGFAPINSPTFTGDPKAPNPGDADDDTSIATTHWVRNVVASIAFTPTPTPPVNPVPGQFWYDLTTGVLAIYVDDGNTKQWVAVTATVTSI